jgi:hypothetical protein
VVQRLQAIGPHLVALRRDQLIGAVVLDMAVAFQDSWAAISLIAPSRVAAVAGRFGIDLEISIYRTAEEDDENLGSVDKVW